MADQTKQDGGSPELFIKKLDRVAGGLAEIEQRWKYALARDGKDVWENWLNGDFAVCLVFDRCIGDDEGSDVRKRTVGKGQFTRPYARFKALDPVDDEGGDQKVVLVELVELGEGPEYSVAACVPVWLNAIENKRLDLWEGDLYRRLSDSVFEILPRFIEREIGERVVASGGRAVQGCPDMVEAATKVVQCVAEDHRHLSGFLAKSLEVQDVPTVRIAKYGKGFVTTCPQVFYDTLKLRDVAFGPFVL